MARCGAPLGVLAGFVVILLAVLCVGVDRR
jgi:hypothetical protein